MPAGASEADITKEAMKAKNKAALEKLSVVEQEFLFEQAFDSVMNHKYPASEKDFLELAALRMQYTIGDYEEGAYITDLIKVHPAQHLERRQTKGSSKTKLTVQTSSTFSVAVLETELTKIKDDIKKEWMGVKGMQADDARKAFMERIQSWNGYGANLFDVSHDMTTGPLAKSPKDLWLAISAEGVGLFPRGERKCLAMYSYEAVLSFGAPVANKYKIMIDQVGGMIFETNMVLEIAKLMKEYIKNIVAK